MPMPCATAQAVRLRPVAVENAGDRETFRPVRSPELSAAGPPMTDNVLPNGGPDSPAASSPLEPPATPTLAVSVTPVLSYALAYNRIAVVHRVDISNPGPDIGAATLRIQVEDSSGPLI